MMRNKFNDYCVTIALSCLIQSAIAQVDSLPKRLDLNKVDVVKSFEATLEDAKIQEIKAVLPTQKPFNPTYTYDITIIPIELNYPDPQIKPLAMNPDGEFIVKKGYVRASYQSLLNPSIKGGYHYLRREKYDIGGHVDLTQLDNSKNTHLQKYNDGTLDLFGSYMVKDNLKVGASLSLGGHTRYLYHTDLNIKDNFTDDQSRRIFYQTSLGTSISNVAETGSKINYSIGLNLQDIKITNQDFTESAVKLKGHFDRSFGDHILGLDISGGYYSITNSDVITLSVFTANPHFKFNIGRLGAHIGINTVVSSNKKDFNIFPDLKISYDVWKGKLMAFADIHLDNFTNNVGQIMTLNPYIDRGIDSLVNTISREYAGGLKGNFGFFGYSAKGGYKRIKDQLLFLNNRQDLRFFDMLYDDLDVVFVNAKVSFNLSEYLSVGGWLTQNIYNSTRLATTWHLPNTEINGNAQWTLLGEKLIIRSDLYFGTKVDFVNKDGSRQQSNLLVALNAGVDYKISSMFSTFVKIDNLLNNKFERFYGYPSVGINFGGGIQAVF